MSALLSVSSAHIAYGKVEAVRSVSLDVGDNEIVTIIGANGAGKTTLLTPYRSMPLKGRVTFAGQDMARPRDRGSRLRRLEAWCAEHRELFATMTVEDNLQLGAFRIVEGGCRKIHSRRVYALFPRLKERRRQLAGTLSGGEQQMLAMGRALMGAPRLLMLDEPSLGLSADHRRRYFPHHRRVALSRGVVLLSNRNAQAALQIATAPMSWSSANSS